MLLLTVVLSRPQDSEYTSSIFLIVGVLRELFTTLTYGMSSCIDSCSFIEVAFGWAVHQVHHSSEEYTLTAGIRQSMFQKCCTFIFYYPLAFLGVPVSALLVHLQLNALYQFWLHTELVTNLGPLEWVLNTPAHHRVHHGQVICMLYI